MGLNALLSESLTEVAKSEMAVRQSVTAQALTTFGTGAAVPLVVEPQSIEALSRAIRLFNAHKLPWRILGAGSNVILPDSPFEQPLVRLGRGLQFVQLLDTPCSSIDHFVSRCTTTLPSPWEEISTRSEGQAVWLLAGAATPLMSLSRNSVRAGVGGLEFAAGIPAQLGGAIRMNAGAHGHSMAEIVRTVFLVDAQGGLQRYRADELCFGYRHAEIPQGAIVVAAELELKRDALASVQKKRNECLEYRRQTQPLSLPSSGSVFRNPSGVPEDHPLRKQFGREPAAAEILEQLGFKGMRRGGVGYSELHANWLVRLAEQAQTADVSCLISAAQESVAHHFGWNLIPEVVVW